VKLRGYAKEDMGEDKRRSERENKKDGQNEEKIHTLNIISGGFA